MRATNETTGEITGEVEGARDFELDRARVRPVGYVAALPEITPARGLVFIIHGFGDDSDDAYAAKLRRRIADEHGLVAVMVDYHCRRARPNLGAQFEVGARARLMLLGLCIAGGHTVADPDDLSELCIRAGLIKPGFQVDADLVPPDGDEQNFGVLQAMDHLSVLGDLRARGVAFDTRRVIALGSSHGGYIAHLMAKIAPNTLAAVIDNSSYVQAPLNFLGLGVGAECASNVGQVVLLGRTKSPWTLDNRSDPAFFDRNRELIRDTGYLPHVKALAEQGDGGPAYFMCNAAEDELSPPDVKRRQHQAFIAAGLRSELDIVDADGIDGKLFKTLGHGLDASQSRLFARHEPHIEARDAALDADQKTTARYDCVDVTYAFAHSDTAPFVAGCVTPLHAELDVDSAASQADDGGAARRNVA